MAQAAFRSYVGLAKDTVNANVYSAVAVGATSLALKNITGATGTLTTAGATYSAVIVDGVLTETVACSGNVTGTTDGSTIAVGATTYAHSINAYVYFQLTGSIGATAWLPVTKIDQADDYVQLYDKAYKGAQVDVWGAQQGTRVANIAFDGDLFPDSFGYIASSFFGAYDYTATSGTTPTQYAFSPLNTGNGQPPPYLVYIYEPGNSNTRVYAKSVCSDLTLKFDPGALAGYSATIKAFASGVVANSATVPPTFTAFTPLPSRVATVSTNSVVTGKVETAEYTFKRQAFGEIFTLQGIQDPLAIFSGPVSVSCKASMIVDDDVELLRYINQSQLPFLLTARIGQGTAATDNGVTVQCTKANYEAVKIMNTGKAWVTIDLPFTAIANTTDATTAGGGSSPVKLTLSTKTTGTSTLY